MNTSDTKFKVFSYLGWASIVFPIIVMFLWISSFYAAGDPVARAEAFKNYFPDSINQGNFITILCTVLSILSVIFSTLGLKVRGKISTVIDVFVIVIAMIIIALNIFSLL